MDPHRFRLATRIHFALLRRYGEDVDVAALLKGSPEAREALWVCEASDDRELVELAAQFKRLAPTPPKLRTVSQGASSKGSTMRDPGTKEKGAAKISRTYLRPPMIARRSLSSVR